MGKLRLSKNILLFCLLSATIGFAQSPTPAIPDSLQKQRDSIKRQMESVRHQVESTKNLGAPMSDFLIPFPPLPALAQADCPALPPDEVDSLVSAAAKQTSVEPRLIRAVMKQESGFKPCAVSVAGAQGLMQLMPDSAARFNVTDPFDSKQNVMAGASFLKELMTKYQGNLKLVLSAYNAGPARTDAAGDVPKIPETQNYVASIMADLGANRTNDANGSNSRGVAAAALTKDSGIKDVAAPAPVKTMNVSAI